MRHFHPILPVVLAVLLGAFSPAAAEESRLWTSSTTGKQFMGVLTDVGENTISIRRDSDSTVFTLKKTDFIAADLRWVEQHASQVKPSAGAIEDLSDLISGIPAANEVPAIGVLLVDNGQTRGIGYSGIRKAGTSVMVEADDRWHLGSCTKSMTATLAASFVEEGALNWDTTIDELLGKDMDILDDYQQVTLGVLLANRSGIPGTVPNPVYEGVEYSAKVGDLKDSDILKQRAQYAEAVLNLPPAFPPGSDYGYSNSGFVVAGAMLEKVAGEPWEKLIQERIFKPLKMTHSGFGNAARNDRSKPSQPWPHKNATTPTDPGPGDDNSWVIGPAGTVHCSLQDAARYIAMHARRELGPVLKKAESYDLLHTAVPDNDDYARGWIVAKTGWSQGPAITHDGSNTMNYCSIWISPERQAAVAAFTNCGEQGRPACTRAIQAVVDRYFKK